MRRYLTTALVIAGMVLLVGAAGDSDQGAGAYIFERAVAGVILLAVGAYRNKKSALPSQPTKARRKSATTTTGTDCCVYSTTAAARNQEGALR